MAAHADNTSWIESAVMRSTEAVALQALVVADGWAESSSEVVGVAGDGQVRVAGWARSARPAGCWDRPCGWPVECRKRGP